MIEKRPFLYLYYAFVLIAFVSALINLLVAIFPVDYELGHDEAEHLHVAYLLQQGQRPYIDFIENHPTLFNHYLRFIKTFFNLKTVRSWAFAARLTILAHILLMIFIFFIWLSDLIKIKPGRLLWISFILISFSCLGYYDKQLASMWQIRPDWLSYSYSFVGFYLFYIFQKNEIKGQSIKKIKNCIYLIIGAILLGLGNTILPKGFVLILGITFGLVALLLIKEIKANIFLSWKFILSSLFYGLITLSSFLLFALADCKLSRINFNSWIKANFILNSIKHLPLTNAQNNPLASISAIFAINFPLIIIMSFWITYIIALTKKSPLNQTFGRLIIITLFVLITNIAMTAFGNGLSWPHYFIPCVFSAMLIYLILTHDLFLKAKSFMIKSSNYVLYAFIFACLLFLSIPLKQIIWAYPSITNLKANLTDPLISGQPDYLNEAIMPPNLIYFSPKPTEMPILAKQAGYYFMLVIDGKIWQDCYTLGLGPKPETHIKDLFAVNPPDILAFQGPIKLYEYIVNANHLQKINLDWLLDSVKENYVLMAYKIRQFYVRKDLVGYLQSLGWQQVRK